MFSMPPTRQTTPAALQFFSVVGSEGAGVVLAEAATDGLFVDVDEGNSSFALDVKNV